MLEGGLGPSRTSTFGGCRLTFYGRVSILHGDSHDKGRLGPLSEQLISFKSLLNSFFALVDVSVSPEQGLGCGDAASLSTFTFTFLPLPSVILC